jgi:hypothetical protein
MKQEKIIRLISFYNLLFLWSISCANITIHGSVQCNVRAADHFWNTVFFTLSIVRYSKEHNVSDSGCFRPQVKGGKPCKVR